jgi:hypothetical protein
MLSTIHRFVNNKPLMVVPATETGSWQNDASTMRMMRWNRQLVANVFFGVTKNWERWQDLNLQPLCPYHEDANLTICRNRVLYPIELHR